MTLPVKALCYYLTSTVIRWRNQDFSTNKIVKAVKGEPINGFLWLKVGGVTRRFSQEHAADLILAVCGALASQVARAGLLAPILVPVPNSIGTREVADFPTHGLARIIATRLGNGAEARPLLRWKRIMEKSHAGGTRNPMTLFNELIIAGDVESERPHVLVDDVCTTGAHLTAASAKLVQAGASVPLAVTVAKTTDEQHDPNILVVDFEVPGPDTLLRPHRR